MASEKATKTRTWYSTITFDGPTRIYHCDFRAHDPDGLITVPPNGPLRFSPLKIEELTFPVIGKLEFLERPVFDTWYEREILLSLFPTLKMGANCHLVIREGTRYLMPSNNSFLDAVVHYLWRTGEKERYLKAMGIRAY